MTMNLPKNPWGEYKRQKPENAAKIASACSQGLFIIIMIGFAYYALKMKPFQPIAVAPETVISTVSQPAHPISRRNGADEDLLRRANKVVPLVSLPQVIHIQKFSKNAASKKELASKRSGLN